MKHSQEEIINALKVIKDVCEERKLEGGKRCHECCLYKIEQGCMISGTRKFPDSWEIVDLAEVMWRAFK